ncbi:PP2C family protein-serine/threonine phosphatase [Streptomyces sp. GESEQ-35]|uniref:PP2C family protein-serine/threonine phosphatase n=1 Tax=Streptomyces sp. GESEQ-35 TaxID=2812657 RepID=UPI0027E23369|nr:PP2C family protein-serine/threonine phosphatase [Streptomyces sp. GESEQ-35]
MVEDDRAARPATASADRFALAERAVAAIGTTLDERKTGAELAAFLAEVLCDAAAVDLFPQDREPDAPPGSLRPVAAAGRRDLLDDLRRTPRGDVLVRALDEGRPLTASFTRAGGNRLAALSVPLLAWDRVFGVVLAVRTDRVFTDDEAAVAHYAARLAAAHLHHAAEHHAAQKTVLNLQEVLLLAPSQPHPNLDMATRYLPLGSGALVGGDWYETVRLHYGRTLLVIGDVMGHGLDAAVDMNAYRSMLRYVASTDLPPHRILRQMDTSMSEDSHRRPATCLLALLDPARGTAAFSSAGHLPPAVFHRDGTGELIDLPVGPPLGTGLSDYHSATVPLSTEDTLLMFTDGLVERRDEDIDASLARLAHIHVHPDLDVSHLLDEVLHRLGAEAADDDVAALAARLRHRP